jgi:hypothetical protein
MNPPLQPHPALNGCHPDRREGSAFSSLTTRRSLHFPWHFLSFHAPFPILVPFVFISLRTLLHLGGRGAMGRGPLSRINTPIRRPLLPVAPRFVLCPFVSYSYKLFCISAKLNSFLFMQFRTLSQKTPGVGGVHSMRPIDFAPQLSANGWSQKILPDGHRRP